jgi:phosphoribosyl 1,2-cyclic phosphodiesterase
MGLKICPLASGSSGNATYVSTGKTSILVDCGPAARDVERFLADIGVHPRQLDGILITHAHSDHYRSSGTIHARHGVPVFVDPTTARAARNRGQHTSWKRLDETRPLPESIGDLGIRPVDTQHGFPPHEGRTVGFVLEHRGKRAAVMTDLGLPTPGVIEGLRGVDALVLEANYDAESIRRKLGDQAFSNDWEYLRWVQSDLGHLSNEQCGELLAASLDGRECHVYLAHLSENHGEPRRDNNNHRLAFQAVTAVLEKHGVPIPHLHRTHRIGREPGRPAEIIEL